MSSLIISFLRGRFVLCIGRVRAQGCVVLGVEDYFIFSSFFYGWKTEPRVFDFEALYKGFWSSVCGGMGLVDQGCGHGRGNGLDMCLGGLVVR